MKDKNYDLNDKNPNFEDKNTVEKISGPPAVWERLKRFCKSERISYSKFVIEAITEKLNREDYD